MPETTFFKRAAAILLALLSILAVSGCDTESKPPDSASSQSYSSAITESSHENSTSSESSFFSSQTTSEFSESSVYSEPSQTDSTSSDNTTPSQSDSSGSASFSSSSSVSSSSGPADSSSSSSSVKQDSKPPDSSSSSEFSSPTVPLQPTPQPSAAPAQPKVRTVSSPKTQACITERGWVDWSNASQGYISAAYTGSKSKAKLRIKCGDKTYDHDLTPDGKECYFPLSCGSGTYTVILYEQVEGTKYTRAINTEFSAAISDEVGIYLYPNRYVDFSISSECVEKASQLCGGKNGDIEKIAAVFGWITENITYDYALASSVKSGYVPDPDSVLSAKKGICFDYASLTAAMLRSQDIPTRLVVGYASPDIYHAWNEVYTTETGWITPQLLLSIKGYNTVDATFYAGADDKSAISQYISDSGNYSAIYYY